MTELNRLVVDGNNVILDGVRVRLVHDVQLDMGHASLHLLPPSARIVTITFVALVERDLTSTPPAKPPLPASKEPDINKAIAKARERLEKRPRRADV